MGGLFASGSLRTRIFPDNNNLYANDRRCGLWNGDLMTAGELTAPTGQGRDPSRARPLKQKFCEMPFTGVGVRDVLRYLEIRTINDPFTYIVTPNVDHVVRNWRDKGDLVEIYEDAELSLCDSRIVSLIGRFSGVSLPVVTGSDLTAILLEYTIDPQERITIIGGSEEVVAKLARRYGLQDIRHHNPPMGFIRDPAAVLEASLFVERNPSRFVFLAVGSPQQEILARSIKERGRAVGIGMCVGASLLFLTGDLQRAPVWMQRSKLEWLHRLAQEPKRMWRRYLYDAPKILRIAAEFKREQRVLVSVVVATAQHEELLPRLIERCGAQAGFNAGAIEVIVVDRSADASARAIVDRSVDRTRAIVQYIHASGSGTAQARDLGVAKARGEFVAFIDQAASPAEIWLEAMLKIHRIYDADVVLGPVQAVFDAPPARHADLYLDAFSYTNDASTGTSFEKRRPMQFTGGGSFVPFRVENAMMLKANYVPSRARKAAAGAGEDRWFFQRMLRDGKRLVWCAEGRVEKRIPPEALRKRSLLYRSFRRSQSTAATSLGPPVVIGDVLAWLVIGILQVLAGSLNTLCWPIARDRGLRGMRLVASGIGKFAFFGGRDLGTGESAVPEMMPAEAPPPRDPVPPRHESSIILEPIQGRRDRRWWRRDRPSKAA
jgi:N-acetylglucosaminyldiphosphoundecaprenol N-acetyl-beta-D-mannosaminyltransferase